MTVTTLRTSEKASLTVETSSSFTHAPEYRNMKRTPGVVKFKGKFKILRLVGI